MKKLMSILVLVSYLTLYSMQREKKPKNPKTKSFRLPRHRSKEKTPKTSLINKTESPIISIEYLLKNKGNLIRCSILSKYSSFSPLSSYTTLYLRNLNISSLVGLNSIPGIEKVTELRLENNKLWYVSKYDFEGLNIVSLDLSNNNITELPDDFFNGLTLQYVNLEGNPFNDSQKAKIIEQCPKAVTLIGLTEQTEPIHDSKKLIPNLTLPAF